MQADTPPWPHAPASDTGARRRLERGAGGARGSGGPCGTASLRPGPLRRPRRLPRRPPGPGLAAPRVGGGDGGAAAGGLEPGCAPRIRPLD